MTVAIAGTDAAAAGTLIDVDSITLGAFAVPPSSIFRFPNGLHGFADLQSFALVPAARDGMYWMQSLAMREIAFLLVDPFVAKPGYHIDLGARELAMLDVRDPADLLVLAIVTLPRVKHNAPTANLRGPVLFNVRTGQGMQTVTADERHGTAVKIEI